MPKIDVVVVGVAGSGTYWMTELMQAHPEVQTAFHYSFPSGVYPPACHYPQLVEHHPKRDIALIWMCRDRTITQLSQLRRGFDAGGSSLFDFDRSMEEIAKQVRGWNGPYIFVSYEMLVSMGAGYLSKLLAGFGLDPVLYPWSKLVVKDGNAKYVKELIDAGK